jgi:hypothetical protein
VLCGSAGIFFTKEYLSTVKDKGLIQGEAAMPDSAVFDERIEDRETAGGVVLRMPANGGNVFCA